MDTNEDTAKKQESEAGSVATVLYSTLGLLGLMAAVAFLFVGPSGQRFGALDFLQFFTREILAVLLGVIVILIVALTKLAERLKPRRAARKPIAAESNGRAWE